MSASDWLQCLDCGHIWDDLNPEHEICDCFDRLGRRRSAQLSTIQVQTAYANANVAPGRALPSSLRWPTKVPETCICLTYGHGLSLTFVVNSQCPFHGPRRDLSPMGGGPVPAWMLPRGTGR